MAGGDRGKIDRLLNAALSHHQAGHLAEAERSYRKILRTAPRHPAAAHLLAAIACDGGRIEEAAELAGRALAARPDFPEALVNLGIIRRAQGRLDESAACLERALALRPAYPDALNSLGLTLHAEGRPAAAADRFRQALGLQPGHADALNNLGNALMALGDFTGAAAAFRQALGIKPGFVDALLNLGNLHKETGESGEAIQCYRRALRFAPGSAAAFNNLGNVFKDQGRSEEAADHYRQALALQPDYQQALSNLLFSLNNSDRCPPESVFVEHVRLAAVLEAAAGPPLPLPAATGSGQGRRLRIGYLSPDFREHSVAYFFLPLLAAHDRAVVETFCYAQVMVEDAITDRLRGLSEHWLRTVGIGDADLAARIRADGVDVLVDLAGHTAHNRLGVFARRAAPVQITWLGYPNTTGLSTIDYRLVDAVTDPEGEADAFASEALIRLPGGFLCYGPPDHAPEPAPPPCRDNGFVTFGSFNNPAKLSDTTLALWGGILRRCPTARLLLKGQSFADAATAAFTRERLASLGVAPERLDLVARIADTAGHLGAYARIDIGLDPTPYNGTTTTCEALWMGVPVVTLVGDRHAGRVGASLLARVGLDDLIAQDRGAYVDVAAALAADAARLGDLRAGLRARLAASPLCDAITFARSFEATCRSLWCRAVGES